jgi:hypothetical protein
VLKDTTRLAWLKAIPTLSQYHPGKERKTWGNSSVVHIQEKTRTKLVWKFYKGPNTRTKRYNPCLYPCQYQDRAGMKVLKRTQYQDQAETNLVHIPTNTKTRLVWNFWNVPNTRSKLVYSKVDTRPTWYVQNLIPDQHGMFKTWYHTNTGYIWPASENSLENTIRSSTVNPKLVFNSSWYLMPNLMSLPTEPINIQATDLTVHSKPTFLILPTA